MCCSEKATERMSCTGQPSTWRGMSSSTLITLERSQGLSMNTSAKLLTKPLITSKKVRKNLLNVLVFIFNSQYIQ